MEFGKIVIQGLDENGNYAETEQNIVDGMVNSPISQTIEERVKVADLKEEMEEYVKFSNFIHQEGKNIIRPMFKIENSRNSRKNGYYYIVKCYTKLVRFENSCYNDDNDSSEKNEGRQLIDNMGPSDETISYKN